jgi:UDP-glucose 4-epimerase
MVQYLKSSFAPLPLDFDPVFQFVNEYDMAKIISYAITKVPAGIYNVANHSEVMTLHDAKMIVNPKHIPVILSVISPFIRAINYSPWSVPDYLLDYLRYSCVINGSLLLSHLPDNFFEYNTVAALKNLQDR